MNKQEGSSMKKKNFMRRAVAALSALAVCAGAAAYDIPAVVSNITTATAISSNTRVRVDINRNDGRSVLYAPNAEAWSFTGDSFKISTGVTVKISNGSGSGSVDAVNNKKLQKYDGTTPYLIADGG